MFSMVTLVVDPEGGVRDDPCGVPRAPDSRFIGGDVEEGTTTLGTTTSGPTGTCPLLDSPPPPA